MKSKFTFFLVAFVMLYASFGFYPRWKIGGTQAAIAWDVAGYYWYLPSLFIYHDLQHQSFKDSLTQEYQMFGGNSVDGFQVKESKNFVLKYSSGMAILYTPFFFIAHFIARELGFPADGFSHPYQFSIQLGGLLFTLLGLWYFRKFLLHFFSDVVVAVTLFVVAVGTNLLNYGAIDSGMPHCWMFTLFVFILITTQNFHQNHSLKNACFLGLLIGLATLARPNEIIASILPLLWGLKGFSLKAFREQGLFLWSQRLNILACFITGALVFSIQLFYWKYVSGQWLVYSYEDQHFNFRNPQFLHFIIGPQNGWWQYTPICSLCFAGFFLFRKMKHAVAIIATSIVFLYLICCWPFYWYGGRFMIDVYPVLFIPFAYLVEWIFQQKWWERIVMFSTITALAYVSFWHTVSSHYGNTFYFDNSSYKYYFASVGRFHVSDDVLKLQDCDEVFEGKIKESQIVYTNDFETDSLATSEKPIAGKHSIFIDDKLKARTLSFPLKHTNRNWLRVKAVFHCEYKEWNTSILPRMVVSFYNQNSEIKSKFLKPGRFLMDGDTKEVYMDIQMPQVIFDTVKLQFINEHSTLSLIIDDVVVIVHN